MFGTQTPITFIPQCGSALSMPARSAAAKALPTTITRRMLAPARCRRCNCLRVANRTAIEAPAAIGTAMPEMATTPYCPVIAHGMALTAMARIRARPTERISSSPTPILPCS